MKEFKTLPMHVAIIMDGNGRWAQLQGKKRIYGHYIGSLVVENITKVAFKLGIKYLTLYAFSTENWKRPKNEVRFLFSLFRIFIRKKRELFIKNQIRFNVIGNTSVLDAKLKEAIDDLTMKTKKYDSMVFSLALNYGSKMEIVQAVKKISRDVKKGSINPENIDENLFSLYLYTSYMPDVDLLIRTGGERRLSNFLLWQSSYAELVFLDKCWPEFTEDDLIEAIREFNKRQRRFGSVKLPVSSFERRGVMCYDPFLRGK